mmetsp:Transcript_49672/g.79000  ORF Transcript_49672/g.79000 Transcript_49672/m.79000 type:complete len:190 (+) Transcript_49672:97-666(+)
MFSAIFFMMISIRVLRALGVRRSSIETGSIAMSYEGTITHTNLTGRNISSEGVDDERKMTFGESSEEVVIYRSAHAGGSTEVPRDIAESLSRYLDAHGVRFGRSCAQNPQMRYLGCNVRCRCSLGMQCYPKSLHIRELSENTVDVGICQLSMISLALLCILIFVGVFFCVIAIRRILRSQELDEEDVTW